MRLLTALFALFFSGNLYAICFGDFCDDGSKTPTPGTPTNVKVPSSNSSGSYSLTWTGSTFMTSVSYYKIEETDQITAYKEIAQVSKGTASHALSNKADGTYKYRIKA